MSAFFTFAKWTYVLSQVLALISTFIAFGAELIGEDDGNGSSASWKWNEVVQKIVFSSTAPAQTVTIKYDSGSPDARIAGCKGGGDGLVGLAVLSLLVFLLLSLPLAIVRALGREHMIPRLGANPNVYTKVELGAAVWHGFSFFCQCVIWGGTCLRLVKADEPAGASVKATGFAYIGFCCALILLNLGLMWYLRAQKLADGSTIGTGASSASSTADPTRFSSVYHQAAAAGDAASGDAQPAPASAGGYGGAEGHVAAAQPTQTGYQTL